MSLLPAAACVPRGRGNCRGPGSRVRAIRILFVFMLWCFVLPCVVDCPFIRAAPLFGADKAALEPEGMVGLLFAIWVAVFGLPLFLLTPDQPRVALGLLMAAKQGVASLLRTLRSLKDYRKVGNYLFVRMLWSDGCNAVLIFGGWIDQRFGSQRGLLIALGGTMAGLVLSLSMRPDTMTRIAPVPKMAEFFGPHALSGTATAFPAPFIVARFTEWSGSNAIGLSSILLLVAGFVGLFFVKAARATPVS